MSYRALARSVPLLFLPLGLLARLPYAMTPLATLLVLMPAGGPSFAGLAAGAQSVAIAGAGLAAGWLAAWLGARRLGVVLAVLNALAVVVLVLATQRAVLFGAAVLVGLTQPHVGLLVRVHWSAALGGTPLVRTALSFESAVDELSFVLGPLVVGLLAISVDGPLLGMAGLLLGAAVPFAAMYAHGAQRPVPASGPRVPPRGLAALALGMAAVGAVFGSVQTAVTAQTGGGGAGFRYACLGVGSALAGLAYAWLPAGFGLAARYVVFSAALVAATGVVAVGQRLDLLAPGLLVAGLAIAPYLITLYTLTEAVSSPAGLPVALGVLGAGGPIGTAAGQAVTGQLVDSAGLRVAWWSPVGWAVFALVLSVLGAAGRARGRRQPG